VDADRAEQHPGKRAVPAAARRLPVRRGDRPPAAIGQLTDAARLLTREAGTVIVP
jgi:hypothetical protein